MLRTEAELKLVGALEQTGVEPVHQRNRAPVVVVAQDLRVAAAHVPSAEVLRMA